MVIQIIDENRKPSTAEKFNKAFGALLQGGQQIMDQRAKAAAIKSAGLPEGYDLLPDEARVAIAKRDLVGPEKISEKDKALIDKYGAETAAAIQKTNYYKQNEDLARRMREGAQGIDRNNFSDQINQNGSQVRPQDFNPSTGLYEQNQEPVINKEQPSSEETRQDKRSDQQLREDAAFSKHPGPLGVEGRLAQSELDERQRIRTAKIEADKIQRHVFESERKYHTSFSKKAEEDADKMRESIPKKSMSLDFARNAVESGNLGYFSPDKLADATGVDLFRTAKGAQLTTAAKENLLSNMGRVSARGQNVWFEQRLNSMFPKIGQSQEANLTVQEMLEGELAMDKAYLDTFDRIAKEDEEKYGYVRKDIQKRAQNEVESIQKQILKRSSYRIREIEEQEMGLDKLKNKVGKDTQKGTPFTLAMAQLYYEKFGDKGLKVAEKNGYYIPAMEEYEIYRRAPQEFREGLAQ